MGWPNLYNQGVKTYLLMNNAKGCMASIIAKRITCAQVLAVQCILLIDSSGKCN